MTCVSPAFFGVLYDLLVAVGLFSILIWSELGLGCDLLLLAACVLGTSLDMS